ncbi:MAG: hypothetical protein RL266_702 [Bacteroidota bacterium]
MKKTIFTLAAAFLSLSALNVVAQDKAQQTRATEERSAENIQKEADAIKARIEQYTIKVEANKDNPKMDYEAEKARLAEMKLKWESVSGQKWKEDE